MTTPAFASSNDLEAKTDLKPANENPCHVLMTSYGEQEGDEADPALHEKNRQAWSYWAAPAGSKREGLAKLGYSIAGQGYSDAKRGGSIFLNRFPVFSKWISASVVLPPLRASAG